MSLTERATEPPESNNHKGVLVERKLNLNPPEGNDKTSRR